MVGDVRGLGASNDAADGAEDQPVVGSRRGKVRELNLGSSLAGRVGGQQLDRAGKRLAAIVLDDVDSPACVVHDEVERVLKLDRLPARVLQSSLRDDVAVGVELEGEDVVAAGEPDGQQRAVERPVEDVAVELVAAVG